MSCWNLSRLYSLARASDSQGDVSIDERDPLAVNAEGAIISRYPIQTGALSKFAKRLVLFSRLSYLPTDHGTVLSG